MTHLDKSLDGIQTTSENIQKEKEFNPSFWLKLAEILLAAVALIINKKNKKKQAT